MVLFHENVGKALVALLSGYEDFFMITPWRPTGASLHLIPGFIRFLC